MRTIIFALLFIGTLSKAFAQELQNTEICQIVNFDGINGIGQTPHFKVTAYNSCFVIEREPGVKLNGINSILFLGKKDTPICGFNRSHFKWYTKIENGWLVDIPDEYADCFNEAFLERGELTLEICYLIPVPVLVLEY